MEIDRIGMFRGTPTDWGVGLTSKAKLPQLELDLRVTHFFNPETGDWEDYLSYDMSIRAYICLYSDKGGTMKELWGADQVKDALGWDGLSFESLAGGNYGERIVSFIVKENEYDGKTTLQVSWIGSEDATPGRSIEKLDAGKLAAITSKFSSVMVAKAAPKAASKSKAAAKKKATKPPKAAAPIEVGVTKKSAWVLVNEKSPENVDGDKLAELWTAAIDAIGKNEDDMTPADWKTVQDQVITDANIPY